MYTCEYCNKEFEKIQSLSAHKGHCKLNPNYTGKSALHLIEMNKKLSILKKEKLKQDIKTIKPRKLICKKCGKEYILNLSDNTYINNKYKKYCSKKCANSHIHSDETKQKIKETLINNFIKKENVKLISEFIKNGDILNIDNFNFDDKYINISKFNIHKCTECDNLFYARITKFGNCKSTKQCSDICMKKSISNKISNLRLNEIKNKSFKGWQSRNILSYPEKFWKNVLDKNNIEYITNYPVKQENNINNWFLDFFIEKNNIKIDLEIDGKQHKYIDRYESDKIRDLYLKSLGYIVYRIDWNEINTDNGKKLMEEKINNFLIFINNL